METPWQWNYICALSVIAAISCSLTQARMAATRQYIVKTVGAAITSFCLKGILYNGCVSWSTSWSRARAARTGLPLTFTIFLPGGRLMITRRETDYDFINSRHTHLICHLEPLQQGYKLLLEVGLLEQERQTDTSILHTQVGGKKKWRWRMGRGSGGENGRD